MLHSVHIENITAGPASFRRESKRTMAGKEDLKATSKRRIQQVRLTTRITIAFLLVQFLLGMWTNLFVPFPAPDGNPFEQIFSNGLYVIAAHLILGIALFGTGLAVLALATLARIRSVVMSGAAGLASIIIAGISGLLFVLSGFQSDPYSYLMSVGFISAFAVYFSVLLQT
jgi:heme A synthase